MGGVARRTTRPLRAVHSALCTRVFLNLRKAAAKECPTNPEFTMLTTLAFDYHAELEMHVAQEELGIALGDDAREEVVSPDGDGEGESSRLTTSSDLLTVVLCCRGSRK